MNGTRPSCFYGRFVYMQLQPSDILKPFIKSYTLITIDSNLVNEVFYPSGYVDLVINISEGNAVTTIDGRVRKTPEVELLGHITSPSRLTVSKGTAILIARIYPYASALFFPNPMNEFTNYATNAYGIFSNPLYDFYDSLMKARTLSHKIEILDGFLVGKLIANEKRFNKSTIVQQVCQAICTMGDAFNSQALSKSFGLSERYIQKLFVEMVGLSPRAFFSVYRFNKSLTLVVSTRHSLTSIGYHCGYYDQAHFIKEFKHFTGITPFEARASLSTNSEEFQQAVNIGF